MTTLTSMSTWIKQKVLQSGAGMAYPSEAP